MKTLKEREEIMANFFFQEMEKMKREIEEQSFDTSGKEDYLSVTDEVLDIINKRFK